MPKISVIIPTYNYGSHISEAIESVLAQSYRNFEAIIVDDGSTDKTAEVVKRFRRQYPNEIQYLYQENAGSGAARNNGIRRSRGEYIAFLDADDIWQPTKLEQQISILEKNNMVSLNFTNASILKNGKISGVYVRADDKTKLSSDLFYHLLLRNFVPFSSIMVKRSVFESAGFFDEAIHYSEDTEWLLRIARVCSIGYIDQCLVSYRVHEANKSRFLGLRHQMSIEILKKNVLAHPEIPRKLGRKLRRRFAQKYFDLGYTLFAENNFAAAEKEFLNSIYSNPLCSIKPYFYIVLCLLPQKIIMKLKMMKNYFAESFKRGAIDAAG